MGVLHHRVLLVRVDRTLVLRTNLLSLPPLPVVVAIVVDFLDRDRRFGRDVVRAELEAQIERLGDDQFATSANEALVELEERYGVTTPVKARVQELTNRYYRGLEVLQALDEPMIVDELAAELER